MFCPFVMKTLPLPFFIGNLLNYNELPFLNNFQPHTWPRIMAVLKRIYSTTNATGNLQGYVTYPAPGSMQ